MTKPRLICDVDGVLADYHQAVLNVLNAHGYHYRRSDMIHFDHDKWMHEDAFDLFESIVMDEYMGYDFYRDLDLLPGAERLLPGGDVYEAFDVVYVTASNRTPQWIKARMQWFVEMGVDPTKQVIFCNTEHKPNIFGDYIIDDNLDVVHDWSWNWHGGNRNACLIDAPWNREPAMTSFGLLGSAYRVGTINEACDKFLEALSAKAS